MDERSVIVRLVSVFFVRFVFHYESVPLGPVLNTSEYDECKS